MSGHPHKGKRNKWIGVATFPKLPGLYETKIGIQGASIEVREWDGIGWSTSQGLLKYSPYFGPMFIGDRWRGLAEKPE